MLKQYIDDEFAEYKDIAPNDAKIFRHKVAAYFSPMATPWEKVKQHKVFVLKGQVKNDRNSLAAMIF